MSLRLIISSQLHDKNLPMKICRNNQELNIANANIGLNNVEYSMFRNKNDLLYLKTITMLSILCDSIQQLYI